MHQEYLHIIYWKMMVIHFNDPPTQAGALHIIFSKLEQGIINFYQWACRKNLKAQCEE